MATVEGKTVRLTRSQAVGVLVHCGWATAGKFKLAKLAQSLLQVKDVVPSDREPKDEVTAAALVQVLAGLEDGATFEVTNDDGSTGETGEAAGTATAADPAPAKTEEEKAAAAAEREAKKAEKAKQKEEEKAKKKAEREAEREGKKAEREKEKADKKAAREAERAAKKAEKKAGVRVNGRGYFAGQVFAKHGLEKGITDELAAEVDALYGKPNTDVSKGALKWAFDAIRGYLGQP